MNTLEFMQCFPVDESDEMYIKESRGKAGIMCKSCKSLTQYYWFSGCQFFGYSHFRRRNSLKNRTMMENSMVSLHKWLVLSFYVSNQKTSERESQKSKGSQRQTIIAEGAESISLEDLEKEEQSRTCGYYKMKVIDKIDSVQMGRFIKKNAAVDMVLFTAKTLPM